MQFLTQLLRLFLRLRQKEQAVALRLFAHSFFASAAYLVCRTVGDSAFLARIGPDLLPGLFVLAAAAVSLVTFVSTRAIGTRHPRSAAIIVRVAILLATGTLALLSPGHHRSLILLGAIYVLAEIRGTLNTVHTVALLNDAFARSPSKAAYAVVAAGAPIAGILTGILIDIFAGSFSLQIWLWVSVAFDIAAISPLLWKVHSAVAINVPARTAIGPRTTRRFVTWIMALMVFKTVVITIIAFVWKVSIARHFAEDEVAMRTYLATFYAVVDALILTMQLAVAGRLLDRFGVRVPLLGFPLLLAVAGFALPFVESASVLLIVMTLAKGMDVVRRGIHDTAIVCLYAPIHDSVRSGAIARVKGVAKPLSEAAAASLIALLWPVSLGVIAGCWLLSIAPWMTAAFVASRMFRQFTSHECPPAVDVEPSGHATVGDT